jgi:thiosulfate/3-mercaptopyruvate sulfurtransferase
MTQNSFVVSAQYLSENLDNPQVVIVDCRFALTEPELGYQQYQISHIPGAYYLDLNKDLSSPVERHGGRHPLPNTTELAKKIAAMGIKFQETLVVAYDNSRFGFGARLWWLLRYMGHDKVTLLNGGWTAWESAGYPLSDAIPTPRPGSFRAQLNPDWVVNIETVKES